MDSRIKGYNHVGINTLRGFFYDVIAHFKYSASASLEILEDMNMETGDHLMKGLQVSQVTCSIPDA